MSESLAHQDPSAVRDFPDRLPPMVVKELRQGLRAPRFGGTVAGFHLMLLVLLVPHPNFAQASEAGGTQRLLWWIVTGVLVLLLPLSGLSTLIQERRENTLDTLLLTNLSAGRIVWGKWLAIASRIVVAGISLLPYTIILYAAGGVSLTESLATLFRLGGLGLTLAAACVALSWHPSWLWRAGPALLLTALALTQFAGPLIRSQMGDGPVSMEAAGLRLLAETTSAAALIYLLLEGASRRLARGMKDHRTGSLGVALALPLLLAAGAGHPSWQAVLGPVCLAALTLVSLTELTAPWPPLHPAVRQGGFPGRHAAGGWPHGIAWALLTWGLLLFVTGRQLPADQLMVTLELTAWLFTGRLLLFCFPRTQRPGESALLGTALLLGLMQAALLLAADLLNWPALKKTASAVPGLMSGSGASPGTIGWVAGGAAGWCGVIALVAVLRHRPGHKEAAP